MPASLPPFLVHRLSVSLLVAGGLLLGSFAIGLPNAVAKDWDFAKDIRPILTEHCLGCHSGEKPAGGLVLGERERALQAGDSGELAIVPNQPDRSEVMRRIASTSSDERMPPEDKKPLTAEETKRIKEWIEQGATWSLHWSFRPIVSARTLTDAKPAPLHQTIDEMVQQKLREANVKPAPRADRYTLIKRLYYDLLGLPPTVDAVDEFVNNTDANAYSALVDNILTSPHFGERWGRHWLDLAHYADSDGYEKDRARPDAYLYRDWVINAFNHDMPFDQFTREQLAGDLIPGANAQQRIATGFLRQTLTNEEGGVDQEEYRVAACFDRTETVGTVWLGLTVGCVRCHDHKYDPLSQRDYYQLFAFFNNAEENKESLPISANNLSELEAALQPLQAALQARQMSFAAAAEAWETEEHQAILKQPDEPIKESSATLENVQAQSTPQMAFQLNKDTLLVDAKSEVPDTDTYEIEFTCEPSVLTGIKVHVLSNKELPGKGPGRAPNGNFVLTGLELVHLPAAGEPQTVPLHRVKADYSQKGFADQNVQLNAAATNDAFQTKTGWGVGGKLGANHSLQLRTQAPLTVLAGDRFKLVLRQEYGSKHVIGSLKIGTLSGDVRGLHIANEAIANALEMYPEKRVANTRQLLFDHYVEKVVADPEVLRLKAEIAAIQKQYQAKLMEVRTISMPLRPRPTRIFSRGDFLTPQQETVESGTPAVLPASKTDDRALSRLELAHWITSPQNPLTARVAVNHVWQHLFGQGIVRTPGDFGTRGEVPTHPELLDTLAAAFAGELKWSRKALIREILLSHTYQQSSLMQGDVERSDPQNMLLRRQNRFRVESEIVRDLHLSVAGLLSPDVGGPSVFPPMPEDLAKLSYANSFTWKNSEGKDRYRRGLYTFFKRTIPHPNMMTFDSPDANVACVARTTSNTPLQSLTLLNNEIHVEAAQAFSQKLLSDPTRDQDDAKLRFAMRLCLARPPVEAETKALQEVLSIGRSFYGENPSEATKAVGPYHVEKIADAELAAWIATIRVVLNLDEFVTRE